MATAVLGGVLILASTLPAQAAPPDPFSGPWRATDNVDDSSLKLRFSGDGDTRSVRLKDDDGTVACETGGPVVATGVGNLDGNVLTIPEYHLVCDDGTDFVLTDFQYEFDPVTGQMKELSGDPAQAYNRPGRA